MVCNLVKIVTAYQFSAENDPVTRQWSSV